MAVSRAANRSPIRFTGMSSGLDTEALVKASLMTDQAKIDSLKSKQTLASWRQEKYRATTAMLTKFKSTYMNSTNAASNMLRKSTYKVYNSKVTNSAGLDSTLFSITGNADAIPGTYNIKVKQRAKAGSVQTEKLGGEEVTYDNTKLLEGQKYNVTLDEVTHEVIIPPIDNPAYAGKTPEERLKLEIENAFPSTPVSVNTDADGNTKIVIGDTLLGTDETYTVNGGLTTGGSYSINYGGATRTVSVPTATTEEALQSALNKKFEFQDSNGFKVADGKIVSVGEGSQLTVEAEAGNDSITNPNNLEKLDKGKGLSEVAGLTDKLGMKTNADGNYEFIVNGETFTFKVTDTLNDVMSKVNANSKANVIMAYDEITDKVTIASKTTGTENTPKISNSDGDVTFETRVQAQNSQIVIDGKTFVNEKNSFTVNGMTVNLLRDPVENEIGKAQTATLTLDSDKIFENIKGVVTQYNEMVTALNAELNNKYEKAYQPLTDEEKEAMSEDDVKKWEEKAKKGLLRRDSILQSITTEMRTAMYSAINGIVDDKGVPEGIYSIGITTSEETDKYGILVIDEKKLKTAIDADPDKIMNIFAKESDISFNRNLSAEDRSQRYKEEGIMQRLSDILEDNISDKRDRFDKKGKLLEKAGIENDGTDLRNSITQEMLDYEVKIKEMQKKYYDKEDRLYRKYASLETAMSKLNSQQSSLAGMLG